MVSVLVVEDEANMLELVSVYLTAAGFKVIPARDGVSGREAFDVARPDVVVMDLMLPGLSGQALLKHIRDSASTPVVVLTARDSDIDKVELLEGGADDYVTKPFSPPELIARIRALLRRTSTHEVTDEGLPDDERVIHIGGLSISPAEREVTVDGSPVDLTTREFDILIAMARRPGVVFSREQLLTSVVGLTEYVDPRGVDVHVRHLRAKLGDDAHRPRFVETVRGAGYRIKKSTQ